MAQVIGFLKGKSAIAIARQFRGKERNFTGEHFWARDYAVSTVGFELEQIRAYIRKQEDEDPDEGGQVLNRTTRHSYTQAASCEISSCAVWAARNASTAAVTSGV